MASGARFAALQQPFENRARKHPAAQAIVGDLGATLTYGELDVRSAEVAYWLGQRGVEPDVIVVVCAERSPELITGLLGVLRAGGAYLPIDPALPPERISSLLDDSGASIVLTDRAAGQRLPDRRGTEISGFSGSSRGEAAKVRPQQGPSDLAYVIYTSGSTGTPKGVLCTHAGIDNRLRWMQRAFRLGDEDVVLHKASIGFDVSVWEIFWPLSQGARVALAPRGAERDPELLGAFMRSAGVTVAHFVPAMLRMFVRSGEAQRTPGLRLVVCSGEALQTDLRDEFLSASSAQLHNLYGPTEAAIDVTHHACKLGEPEGAVPIGRPIDNVRVLVLGENREVVPPGVEGEIHIGGVALARGYHRRPDLTAAAFVADLGEPGSVVYRTGDRGRWRHDGELEYLGRRDDQVKIRGARIELGEVEAALSTLPAISDCAVMSLPGEGGFLVGFVDAEAPPGEELRKELRAQLPEAAVPARFVHLDSMPRLANGKLDRSELRARFGEVPAPASLSGPLESEAELSLVKIWSEILGVPAAEITTGSNFFALGGDSIRSIELVFRARSAGLQLTTQDVFRQQTLGAITAIAACDGAADEPAGDGPVQAFALLADEDRTNLPVGVVDAFPLSVLLRGLMAEAAANDSYLLYTTSLTIRGRYDAAALKRSVGELVRRHPILRSAFAMTGYSQPLHLVFATATADVEEIDARGIPEAAWPGHFRAWIERERRIPLDFATPPLFRFTAHRRAEGFHLTLTEPYLDGWSMTLLLTELLSHYDASLGGREAALTEPPRVTMADLVEAEQTLNRDDHRLAWRSRLAGAGQTKLPRATEDGDRLRGPERLPVPVSAETSRRLQRLPRALDLPLKTILLAAHLRVVAAISGREDVTCGLMVNGRPETRDGERAIGMFLNVVPLRVDVGPSTWAGLARAVHEAETDVLRWRRYPYQWLLKDLGGQHPFETVFNFTRFRPYNDWGGKAIELLDIGGTDQTYFGLTVQAGVGIDGEVEFAIELNPDGLSRQQAAELTATYEQTLAQIAAAPDARHEQLPLVPPRRRPHRSPAATRERVETLLARRAADSPAATAFVEGASRRSFASMKAAAAAVAGQMLDRLDERQPQLVAIHMRRSLQALEAIFASLELGAAFLPLDPDLPPDRVERILADARPDLLVDGDGINRHPGKGAFDLPAAASDPLHFLYTSGSSGTPNGVLTSHGALLNRLRWISRAFPAKEDDLYCASGGVGFVDTITSLFSGLFDGIPVYLPPDPPPTPARFAKLVHDVGITRVTLVPSVLRDLLWEVGEDGRRLFAGVDLWLLSGEALPTTLARRLRQISPRSTILNLYGSTEIAGDVTAHVVRNRESGPNVPAGTPIDGVDVRIVDRYGRDLPIGVDGEIVVSGEALACGYVGDRKLTRKRFRRANPRGSRQFWTGDLGRLRADRSLEVRGRIDRQLKLNGVRVEPAEIESQLDAHPTVREAAVCEIQRGDGSSRLAAFVVGDVSGEEVRRFLSSHLPSGLIPSAVVSLARLPRTASGKVDYRLLESETPPESPPPQRPPVAGSATEQAVIEIWREVLDADEIDPNQDFFELGGDSLSAAKVLARMEERLGARMGLRELFDSPTPRRCATRFEALSSSRHDEVAGVGH